MINNDEKFQADKASLLAEKAVAENREKEVLAKIEEFKLDTQLEAAFNESGGIGGSESLEAIKAYLRSGNRMQNENGRIVFVDSDGLVELGENGPKTPAEKLKELGTTSAFKSCFSGEASSSKEGGNSQQDNRHTYTKEEARAGKANIKDLAFGRAKIEGINETPRPNGNKVNITEIANLKKRQWD